MLLLHGFPEFWYGWRHQIPALVEAGYRVVAPDQRGYNLSDKPNGRAAYQIDNMAADAVGILDALGCDSAIVTGHDWGGIVAWQLALRYPERVHKLAILNVPHPSVMYRFLTGSFEQLRKSWYMFFFQLPWLPEVFLRRNNHQLLLRMLRGRNPDVFTKADRERYSEAWSQPRAMTSMLNWYRAMFKSSTQPRPDSQVRVPTLVIWGKRDSALSYEMAQPSVDRCDDGRLVLIDEAGHFVQHDAPEQVNQSLTNFFGD